MAALQRAYSSRSGAGLASLSRDSSQDMPTPTPARGPRWRDLSQYNWVAASPGRMCLGPVGSAIQYLALARTNGVQATAAAGACKCQEQPLPHQGSRIGTDKVPDSTCRLPGCSPSGTSSCRGG
jgi:hypothetical protein